MDRLEAVFRTGLYVTERIDTSMGIRRKDPQDDRPKKDHKQDDAEEEQGEDRMTLSVHALHGFLNMLLQQPDPSAAPSGGDNSPRTPSPDNAGTAAGAGQPPSHHRAAASAYQSTARSGANHPVPLSDPPPPDAAPQVILSATEREGVKALLRDVEILAEKGVATITLPPAPVFLQSLSLGVREALEKS